MLAEGLTAAQIAAKLVISPKTVATHVQRILAKLGVHSRTQAVVLAYESGFLAPMEPESQSPPLATATSGALSAFQALRLVIGNS